MLSKCHLRGAAALSSPGPRPRKTGLKLGSISQELMRLTTRLQCPHLPFSLGPDHPPFSICISLLLLSPFLPWDPVPTATEKPSPTQTPRCRGAILQGVLNSYSDQADVPALHPVPHSHWLLNAGVPTDPSQVTGLRPSMPSLPPHWTVLTNPGTQVSAPWPSPLDSQTVFKEEQNTA